MIELAWSSVVGLAVDLYLKSYARLWKFQFSTGLEGSRMLKNIIIPECTINDWRYFFQEGVKH